MCLQHLLVLLSFWTKSKYIHLFIHIILVGIELEMPTKWQQSSLPIAFYLFTRRVTSRRKDPSFSRPPNNLKFLQSETVTVSFIISPVFDKT